MKIPDIMKQRMSLSFEVFPPKTEEGIPRLINVLDELYAFRPDFISCTYGAGGSNAGRNFDVCKAIQDSGKSTAVTHFSCIGQTRKTVITQLDNYLTAGINHLLALRGDLPEGWEGTRGDFKYATELVAFIREQYGDKFTIAVSGSPEGHIACRSLKSDISFLRRKQDEGADYIMTQLTYDMDQFRFWLDAIRKAGVYLPVDVGVMPVLSKDACLRMCLSTNGCAIPSALARLMSRYYNDPDGFKEAGKEYTVDQIHEYISCGVNGIHMYSLNKSGEVADILGRAGISGLK